MYIRLYYTVYLIGGTQRHQTYTKLTIKKPSELNKRKKQKNEGGKEEEEDKAKSEEEILEEEEERMFFSGHRRSDKSFSLLSS